MVLTGLLEPNFLSGSCSYFKTCYFYRNRKCLKWTTPATLGGTRPHLTACRTADGTTPPPAAAAIEVTSTGRLGNTTGSFGLLLLLLLIILFTTACCCCCCCNSCCWAVCWDGCGEATCWRLGLARGRPTPAAAARLAKAVGGRLMTPRRGLAGRFLARHSSQLAISGSLRSPWGRRRVSRTKIFVRKVIFYIFAVF